ncbi:MAG: 3-deoxy-D-manno-octulosonic acid transferase [Thermoguttaceae bacterium]|nr:3-deoxy-D-manno-octulosonic acid transferase [Thermoguttaceae bacterium]MDW8078438.1 3-deoxy-D-manno-octulosonic acid transferase [Thermoguttaceae bacterium]
MLPWLVNLFYLSLLGVASPYLAYQMISRGKYRHGWSAKLLGFVPLRSSRRPCVWIHAVSVGEVNLLAPLVDRLLAEFPDFDYVLSTTTATGMAVARTKFPELLTFYCPLDFSWATRRALRRIRPSLLILTELEIWPNLIWAAKKAGAGVAIINGRLSERSFRRYCWIQVLMGRVIGQIDWIFAQSPVYAERFIALGADPGRVVVTGSMKFDGAETCRDNPRTAHLRQLAGIISEDIVFLAGSTQDPEERYALEAFLALRESYPRLRLIVVPRHPHRFESVARLLDASGVAWQRRTELEGRGADPSCRVLLVDTVGELKAWWGTAHIAFVGGSLGNRGGQNMIEPAAFGAAVSFGPNTQNFRDIVDTLLTAEAARVVRNQRELAEFVHWCLARPAEASAMGRRAQQVVLANQGATARTLAGLRPLLVRQAEAMRSRFAA